MSLVSQGSLVASCAKNIPAAAIDIQEPGPVNRLPGPCCVNQI
jgi:hypothetical protein